MACQCPCFAGKRYYYTFALPSKETLTRTIQFDNFEGAWGEPKQLDTFLQAYAVEKCRLEARAKGHTVSETAMSDGSIKLQIVVGA